MKKLRCIHTGVVAFRLREPWMIAADLSGACEMESTWAEAWDEEVDLWGEVIIGGDEDCGGGAGWAVVHETMEFEGELVDAGWGLAKPIRRPPTVAEGGEIVRGIVKEVVVDSEFIAWRVSRNLYVDVFEGTKNLKT